MTPVVSYYFSVYWHWKNYGLFRIHNNQEILFNVLNDRRNDCNLSSLLKIVF